MIHLDTHVAVWLYEGNRRRLKPVMKTLESEELRLSPFVMLELQTLFEIGRTRGAGSWVAGQLLSDFGVQVETRFLDQAADRALALSFTRDPFDRLIAGHALAAGAELLTVDETLREHVAIARWP